MNKVLVEKIRTYGVSKEMAENILRGVIDCIIQETKAKERFSIYKFGTFYQKESKAKTQKINGKVYDVSARTVIKFKPSKHLIEKK